MSAASALAVGVFCGPWETGHVSQDGAVMGFADVEHALGAALAGDARFRLVPLDLSLFVSDDPASRLAGLDIVYGNCGPLASLLFPIRETARLRFAIVREVRTLGWIGYAFQEYVAQALQRPGDACAHVASYSMGLWERVRPAADRMYYPMLREAATARPPAREPSTCGYFSRVSADKGIEYVATIVARMREAGWPLTRLAICGAVESEALLERCRGELRRVGVEVAYHGELAYRPALRLMESVDVVLFPSVSSIEASGRVVVEAYQLGKPVIASDYCAARDVLAPAFRVPLAFDGVASGPGASAFPIARLALEGWRAPPPGSACFIPAQAERYRLSREDTTRLLLGEGAAAPRAEPCADTPRMAWHWDECRERAAPDWCALARDILRRAWTDRRDLLDLGGAFKRSLLAAGFNPRVSFQAAPISERNSSYLPEGLRGISS